MSNSKKGLTHWPFDIHFWDDIKIRKLIKYQGGKAPQVFALLLCYIYEVGYYITWDEELPFILSEKLGSGYDEAYVLEVLNCCVSLGLLDKELYEKKILTSAAIQARWKDISESLRRKSKLEEYNLLEVVVPPQNEESSPQNDASSPQNVGNLPTIELNRIEENRIE